MSQSAGLARTACRWVALVGLATGCSSGSDNELWAAELASVPCSEAVRSTLSQWGAGDEMFKTPPGAGFQVRFRFPTANLGEWLRLETDGSEAKVSLVTADRVRTRAFAGDCTESTTEEANRLSANAAGAFTDEDLRRAIEAGLVGGSVGVAVYLWSPHMPLSVEGYAEIVKAAASLGLYVVPLLLPGSAQDFAVAEAMRSGIPEEGLREAASVELIFRDAQVHAPSIIVFNSRRVSAVLPGYRSAEGYREFLTDFVAPSS